MDAYIQNTIKAAMEKAERERQAEESDDYIPQPDPPSGANTWTESSMDDDDDEVTRIAAFFSFLSTVIRDSPLCLHLCRRQIISNSKK